MVTVHALLLHSNTVQVARVTGSRTIGQPQLLAGGRHALELPHQVALALLALLAAEHEPAAVDRPVPKVSVAGHPKGRGDVARVVAGEVLHHVDQLGVLLLKAALFAGGFALAFELVVFGLGGEGFGAHGGGGEGGCGCGEGGGCGGR